MIPNQNPYWRVVRDALESASSNLKQLTPKIMSMIHVGPTNGDPERYHITLRAYTNSDMSEDEKRRLISQAKPIIEQSLLDRDYPASAIPTFTFGVMYEKSVRNMETVGKAMSSVHPQLRKLFPSVVSTYHMGPFGGEPDNFVIYRGVDAKGEFGPHEQSRLIDMARPLVERSLRWLNYPVPSIETFSYIAVSQEEVEKSAGGTAFCDRRDDWVA